MVVYLEQEELVVGKRYHCETYDGRNTLMEYTDDGVFDGFYPLEGCIRYVFCEFTDRGNYKRDINHAIRDFQESAQAIADDCFGEIVAPYLKTSGIRWTGQWCNETGFQTIDGLPVKWSDLSASIMDVYNIVYTSEKWNCPEYANYLRDLWPIE